MFCVYNEKIIYMKKRNTISLLLIFVFLCPFQNVFGQNEYSIFQKKYQHIFLNHPDPLEDTDGDGLNNKTEISYGTNPNAIDSDGDGLDDYLENFKYHTNPLNPDSDSDGVIDSVWTERFEYTYTIKVFAKIGEPFDVSKMESFFFDARIINYDYKQGLIEYIIYPFAEPYIVPLKFSNYPVEVKKYLETDNVTRIERKQLEEVLQIVNGAKSDFEKIYRIIKYVRKNFKLKDELFAQSEPFMEFQFEKEKTTSIHQNWSPKELYQKYSIDSILKLNCFVQSMVKNKSKGACGSTATLMAGLIRSVGIPCRIKQSFPLATNKDSAQVKLLDNITNLQVRKKFNNGISGDNHFFNEVYLNGHWIDLDNYRIGNSWINFPFLKTIHFNSWYEVGFANKWDSWCVYSHKNGRESLNIRFKAYQTISVIEQYSKYEQNINH